MIDWPSELVHDIARRRAVLFLGAGVSRNSVGDGGQRPPDWLGFLERAIDVCPGDTAGIRELIERRDYLTACEILRNRLDEAWNTLLTQSFSTPRFRHADIHEHLFRLDVRVVCTPNFDKIYDLYAQSQAGGTVMVKRYDDADNPMHMRRDYRVILKVHGTIDVPTSIIFTRQDYARMRNAHRAFQALMDALLMTHTFLFVGSSVDDPDLRMFLEQHAYLQPSAPPHYITVGDPTIDGDLVDSYRHNMNLKALTYDPEDAHLALTESLGELVTLVDEQRAEIADRQDW